MTKENVRSTAIFMLILFVGIGSAVFLYFYQIIYKSDNFLPGVKIAQLSVAGKDRAEAALALQYKLDKYRNTPVLFYMDEYSHETKLEDLCVIPNYPEIVKQVWQKETERGWQSKILNFDGSRDISYPVEIEYRQEIKEGLLNEWNKTLSSETVDASLEVDKEKGLIIIPGSAGKEINSVSTFANLPQQWEEFDEEIRIPIVISEKPPQVQAKDLQAMGELSSFSTWFNAQEINRSHNLYLAASSINNTMLAPGEVFSFNKKVGERVIESGYRDALVIVNGKFEPGLGGGVCQVSSTLYNACLLAGLEIVERHNHALTIAYVPLGRDATVVYGLQDFRFKNNTLYPIYIRSIAQAGKLNIDIYGHLTAKKRIELNSIVDRSIDFKEVRIEDPSLQPGEEKLDHAGYRGYVVRSFRTIFDEEGNVISKEQLATDHYKPLDKLVYVGPPEQTTDIQGDVPNTPPQDEVPSEGGTEPVPIEGTESPPLEGTETMPLEEEGPQDEAPIGMPDNNETNNTIKL